MTSSFIELLQNKIQYVFNRIELNFIKEIKNKDATLKSKLKKNYMVFDKLTDKHIIFYIEKTKNIDPNETFMKQDFDCETDLLENDDVKNLEILQGIKVHDILSVVKDEEKSVVKCYLYMMYMLSYLFKEATNLVKEKEIEDDPEETSLGNPDEENDENDENDENEDNDEKDDEKDEELKNRVLQLESMFTKSMKIINKSDDTDFDNEVENIINEDLQLLLKNIHTTRKNVEVSPIQDSNKNLDSDELETNINDEEGLGTALEFLHNSKIGELAKEISQDIDMSKLNVNNPEELLNIENMFSGENNVLGDIIGKVSSKITNKIQNGEIKQDELMNEAFSMMTKLNGTNSFMEDMMKSAMSQHSGANYSSSSSGRKQQKQMQLKRRLEEKNRLKN